MHSLWDCGGVSHWGVHAHAVYSSGTTASIACQSCAISCCLTVEIISQVALLLWQNQLPLSHPVDQTPQPGIQHSG